MRRINVDDPMHHELAEEWRREKRRVIWYRIAVSVVAFLAVIACAVVGYVLLAPTATGWRGAAGGIAIAVTGMITDDRIAAALRWMRGPTWRIAR